MPDTKPREHILQLPFWFKFLVTAKIVIAVAVLALSAYALTFNDFFAGNGYAIFCVIAIFVTEGYFLATSMFITSFFNAWVYLAVSFFQVIWWLACWADLAAWAGAYKLFYVGLNVNDIDECSQQSLNSSDPYDYDAWNDGYYDCLTDKRKKHRDVVAAAAGISALEWILMVVSFVFVALAVWRHKKSGAPFTAGGGWRATAENPHGAPGGGAGSHQMQPKSEAAV